MGIRDDRLWGWGNLVRIFFESGIFFFDLFLVFLTFCASYLLVGNFWTAELTISTNVIVGFGHHAKVLFFILPVSLLLFGLCQMYYSYRYRTLGYMIGRILLATMALILLLPCFSYMSKGVYLGRGYIIAFAIFFPFWPFPGFSW